jgi:hypothetical protein
MTNREWINSLSDEELSAWLCDNLYLRTIEGITIYSGISSLKSMYTHSELGIIEWLKKERN